MAKENVIMTPLPPVHADTNRALLTLAEVAIELRCSKTFASRLARGLVHGVPALPVVRLGRRVLVRREALLDWLCRRSTSSVVR